MNSVMFKKQLTLMLKNYGSFKSIYYRNEFTSAISLKSLYPASSVKITSPEESMINKKSTEQFSGYIPLEKIEIRTSRSSGPGGQHVNKINTKVELRFQVESADWIPEDIRKKLMILKKNQLTKEGHLIIRSDKTRSQHLNLADVLYRLRTIIYKLIDSEPKAEPLTEMQIRKRQEKANRERLMMKKHRSLIKLDRQSFEL